MTTVDNNVSTKIRFKITTKGMGLGDSGDNNRKNTLKFTIKNPQSNQVTGAGDERPKENSCVKPPLSAGNKKRSPERSLVSPKGKTRKMDRTVKVQCGNILKDLMKHSHSPVFRVPVDPVRLHIPDYFTIIKNPMDLGTIKKKLDGNCYSTIEEFSADVRLTFSNAEKYNGETHPVSQCARTLNNFFDTRWKALEARLTSQKTSTASEYGQVSRSAEKSCLDTKKVSVSRAPPVCIIDPDNNKPMSSVRRQNVPMSSVEKLNHRSEKLRKDDLKIVLGARAGKADYVKLVKTGSNCSGSNVQKAKCPSCDSLMCHCLEKNAPDQAFSSDLSSGRSSDHEISSDSKQNTAVKCSTACETIQSGPDSDGPGVVVNGSPLLSLPSATAASGEGWNTIDIPLSPKKALRAAKLKARFAATIFKATHQGDKSDPLTLQQEREKLEREQREEKARIEKEIKAAEAAMQKKAQEELKMQREKEREAARIALQKMERTVEIYESHDILRELESLCYSPVGVNPLKELGLHMKDDDYMDLDDLDGEEGEIVV